MNYMEAWKVLANKGTIKSLHSGEVYSCLTVFTRNEINGKWEIVEVKK